MLLVPKKEMLNRMQNDDFKTVLVLVARMIRRNDSISNALGVAECEESRVDVASPRQSLVGCHRPSLTVSHIHVPRQSDENASIWSAHFRCRAHRPRLWMDGMQGHLA
jgi:hypothetical protein